VQLRALGGPVVVENRPGAGGVTGADFAAKSTPDGLTLLMGVTGSNAIAGSLYPNLPYAPVRSFAPVSRLVSAPLVLVVNLALPAQDVAGYIAAARAAPGAITFAAPGNGTSMHLAGVMFSQIARVEMTHVPYRGSAQALTDLVSGLVRSTLPDLLVVPPQIRAGAFRPLAVTARQPHALLPEVPTMAEAGLPGFEAASWQELFAPAILQRLYAEVAAAMGAEEIRDVFSRQGFLVEATPPGDTGRWAAIVRSANVTLD